LTPIEIITYTIYTVLIICFYELGKLVAKKIRDNRQYKKWEQEREREEAMYEAKQMAEIEEDLGNCGWLEWTLKGGVTKDKMVYYLKHLIWGEDRENLAHLRDFVRMVMKRRGHNIEGISLEYIIYLVSVDERVFDSGEIFEITMNIGILPSFISDIKERRLCIQNIINELDEYVHDTHGDAGEMDLKVGYIACEEEDEV
jgi:hypothetical protein